MATRRGAPQHREPIAMAGVQARIPVQFAMWLNDQAAEGATTVSQVIRDCIAAAILKAGDAKRYGIDVVDLAEDES